MLIFFHSKISVEKEKEKTVTSKTSAQIDPEAIKQIRQKKNDLGREDGEISPDQEWPKKFKVNHNTYILRDVSKPS